MTWSRVRSIERANGSNELVYLRQSLCHGGAHQREERWGGGIKVIKFGWRFKCCSWIWAFLGSRKVILWPLLASSLERWRNEVMCPTANHGNMAMWSFIESQGFWENNIYYIFLTVHCSSCDVFIFQSVQRLTLIRKANTFETETLNDKHMLSFL